MAAGALLILLVAVGCREVWRRTRHVTGQQEQGGPIPPSASATTAAAPTAVSQRSSRAIWPRVRRMGAGRVLLILVVVIAALAGISDAIARFRGESAHCMVGLKGTAVSVSVDGPGALIQCQSFLQTYPCPRASPGRSNRRRYLDMDGSHPADERRTARDRPARVFGRDRSGRRGAESRARRPHAFLIEKVARVTPANSGRSAGDIFPPRAANVAPCARSGPVRAPPRRIATSRRTQPA